MVKVAPLSSSRVALPLRAASERRRISDASCHTDRDCASRIVATISPFGVCVATPMCTEPWRVMTIASSSNVALSIGHSARPRDRAVIRNGRSVSLGFEPRSLFIIAASPRAR